MDEKNKPPRSRAEKILNDVLVAANGCLVVTAILLASLILIQLEVASWRAAGVGSVVPSALATVY